MLVLSRTIGEAIVVNRTVRITVVSVSMSRTGKWKVKLGIEAPPGVVVDREEIDTRKHGRSAESADLPTDGFVSAGGTGVGAESAVANRT